MVWWWCWWCCARVRARFARQVKEKWWTMEKNLNRLRAVVRHNEFVKAEMCPLPPAVGATPWKWRRPTVPTPPSFPGAEPDRSRSREAASLASV